MLHSFFTLQYKIKMLRDPVINIIAVLMKEAPAKAINQFKLTSMLGCHSIAKVSLPAAALAPVTSLT